jgi:ABC-type uncharacterized transport system substrate-binding protein
VRRREFITLLGGAAAWPLAARAQQREKVRLIGILLPATADNRDFQARLGAFLQGLQQSGWSIGRNVQIETRWATAKAEEIRRHAAELAALAPDAIVAHGSSTVGATLQATHTVPIVFPAVGDPVAAGFVDSLARPGGNATGFMSFEYGLGRKMAGTGQGDRANGNACRSFSRSCHTHGHWDVRRNPIRSARPRHRGNPA